MLLECLEFLINHALFYKALPLYFSLLSRVFMSISRWPAFGTQS